MIDYAALLGRPETRVDEVILRSAIAGRRVLITGAGGSIGSELARRVYTLNPERLVLVDRAEGPLYDVEQELALRNGSAAKVADYLVDVSDATAILEVMSLERPDLVLHAAAYKHVPMMERYPADAVRTNIGGTLATVRASIAVEVPRFVFVSTDKAVEPSSVMGATKRLAEMAVAGAGYVSVRFGNVLGSSGSVVPLFLRQMREDRPVTLTDPAITRYFITIGEAACLLLAAAAIGRPRDLLVLEMGEPVRIADLALDLSRATGYAGRLEWRYIGLRPGEKLHEALSYDAELLEPTEVAKILRVAVEAPPALDGALDTLVALAASGDHDRTRTALWETLGSLS
jgi:FlaA1/EpsC-like NDP-sugar epimerase